MALRLDDKKAVVAEVAEVAAKAHSAIAAEYRGLSVGQMTELRNSARKAGVYIRVVKNSLTRRAVEPIVWPVRTGQTLETSDLRSGDQSVNGCNEGSGRKTRQNPGRASRKTGSHRCCGQNPEGSSLIFPC